jgi:cytochrome P450
MSGDQRNALTPKVPDHVPAELVRAATVFTWSRPSADPFAAVSELHVGPRLFYNPVPTGGRPEGSWTLTRAADCRHVLQNPQIFSSKGCAGFSQLVNESWDLIPLEKDPPLHTRYRSLLNPWMSPTAMARLLDKVRDRACELIEAIKDRGGCEFMEAFGRPFPVSMFMELMGLPLSQMKTFLRWEEDLLNGPDITVKKRAAFEILGYLRELAAERRRNPVDDLASRIATAQIDGKLLADDEMIGIYYLLFVGGLDTVASSLGFYFHHLATHPQVQARLRAEPEITERAVEEYLRRFSVVTTVRTVTQDTDLAGISLKRGEYVTLNYASFSLDPEEFERPLEVDFDRKGVRHFGFAFGPHFCLGVHLARRELQVALREWVQRIPPFRLDPKGEVRMHGGGVFGVDRLDLIWS